MTKTKQVNPCAQVALFDAIREAESEVVSTTPKVIFAPQVPSCGTLLSILAKVKCLGLPCPWLEIVTRQAASLWRSCGEESGNEGEGKLVAGSGC
jgi:hypothetical protein